MGLPRRHPISGEWVYPPVHQCGHCGQDITEDQGAAETEDQWFHLEHCLEHALYRGYLLADEIKAVHEPWSYGRVEWPPEEVE